MATHSKDHETLNTLSYSWKFIQIQKRISYRFTDAYGGVIYESKAAQVMPKSNNREIN